jgi:anthranilate synthase/indole-3-glycerol phosphate synthase/phosphoribosylanthranilate isomerase
MDTKEYSETELKAALASMAQNDSSSWKEECSHLYGFNNESKNTDDLFLPNHKLSMLQTITARRILDYNRLLSHGNAPKESDLLEMASAFLASNGPILNLLSQIKSQSPSMALAAEFKRASPSKGNIAPDLKAGEQAMLYARAGASTISILTEEHWFKGSLQDLTEARLQTTEWARSNNSNRPAILRKDFCISNYMIAEAAAAGADTVLLIVAITPFSLLCKMINYARSLGMEPLVEVHADIELDIALKAGAKVIGVNNRNLHTFQMDLATTDRTAEELRRRGFDFAHGPESEYALCALSGMSSANDVDRYRQKGVGMCLIGESLMRAADVGASIKSLCLNPKDYDQFLAESNRCSAYTGGTKIVKVCGITNPEDALIACKHGANLIGVIFVPKSKRFVTAEQAKSVVDAVRVFGERNNRLIFPSNIFRTDNISPLQSLILKSKAIEDIARRPLVVGVFQNQSHEFIREMVDICGLDLVQLHGKEGMDAANVQKCTVPAIRVVDIETNPDGSGSAPDTVERLLKEITTDPLAILLDTSIKGSKDGGGTGVTFDWSIAEKLQNNGLPVIVAGGLTPENIKDAVGTVRPWGIDVSSGVEASPGKKDIVAVEKFIKGAREAASHANKGF